jgi:hypothetical protein
LAIAKGIARTANSSAAALNLISMGSIFLLLRFTHIASLPEQQQIRAAHRWVYQFEDAIRTASALKLRASDFLCVHQLGAQQ